MTQREAAEELGLSPRWVRKLLARMRAEGDGGILQRLRGRESNRKLGEPVRRQALDLIGAHYADYGPTLAAEVLAAEHSIAVSRETLRGWMSSEPSFCGSQLPVVCQPVRSLPLKRLIQPSSAVSARRQFQAKRPAKTRVVNLFIMCLHRFSLVQSAENICIGWEVVE